jgi:polyphosphate kinase 2 (PPK2 family)
MLEALDLSKKLPKVEYRQRLPRQQERLHRLQRACWKAGLATVVVFEGWDAAGKGTAIGKLTQRLEPRGFTLHATREPRTSELHLPWLWRFWVRVPNWGEIAIFDRSWYGRVWVERVEGRIDETQLRQAYGDIVSFERALADDRYLIVKFFLHISRREQAKRLKRLARDPRTAWQVEKEDWHRHKEYDSNRLVIEEMLERTESEWGPWTLVEATDRRWARAKILDTLIQRMERGLTSRGHDVPEAESEPGASHLEVDDGDD